MSRVKADLASSKHHTFSECAGPSNTLQSDAVMPTRALGRMPNIAIIGAGVSGLRCADLLLKAGVKVMIFEARNRIGGRVHQLESGGHLVDMGANWIHGITNNPIMDLAEKTKTLVWDPDEGSVMINTDGTKIPEKDAAPLTGILWAKIGQAMKYSDEKSESIDPGVSLFDWLTKRFRDDYGDDPARITNLTELSRLWGHFVGMPVTKQSLKFFWLEEGPDGENVFVASTYKKILQQIAQPALAGAEVRLESEVENVSYRTEDNSSAPVNVTLRDGQSHEFDEVVVTCPLGWLKQHAESTFTPGLPPRLRQAINNIGYGALEKLYVTFPTAFWLKDGNTDTYPPVTEFLNPTYHPDLSPTDTTTWNLAMFSLAHLPQPAAHPTLLFYMHGDCGAYLAHKCADLERGSRQYNEILQRFATPFYSRLPNYNAESTNCIPSAFCHSSWQTDKFAGYGGYSCFPTGLTEGDIDIETMRNAGGLSDAGRGLWLAGEHTAPFIAMGTTTGAYWSGEAVAKRMLERYGLSLTDANAQSTIKHTIDPGVANKRSGNVNGHT